MPHTEKNKLNPMAEAVRKAYRAGQEDEQLEPHVRVDSSGKPIGMVKDGDYVIFYDIRGEREVQITRSFTETGFDIFPVPEMNVHFVTMIEYDPSLDTRVAFPPQGAVEGTLSEVVSKAGMKQVKICESEKAVHVCFFLNGKRHDTFKNEKRVVIESPRDVPTFDLKPEMSADQVVEVTLSEIRDQNNDLIIVNFANVDVVGHTEDREPILKAVSVVDNSIGRTVEEALKEEMIVLVTADHGTVEKWYYPDGTIDTGHTDSPVPFIVISNYLEDKDFTIPQGKGLIDVAPTVLEILGLEYPAGMVSKSLINKEALYKLTGGRKRNRVLLIIADGWGYNKNSKGNLIAEADTPVMDRLLGKYPSTTLIAAGEAVGLPVGTVGNSEAGHMHMGAGRVIYSDRMRINRSLEDGTFYKNKAFLEAIHGAERDGTRLHLYGIVSFYSSHGSVEHLEALIDLVSQENVPELYIHSLLGRRGERPESGALYIDRVERKCNEVGLGKLVTVTGRYWALDREQNWDRVEKAYRAMVYGDGTPVLDE